jgi:heme exporter protein C
MSARLHALANPARFLRFARRVLPWTAALAALCIGVGAVWGVVFAPAGAPPPGGQGETVRIIYVHVPSAWMALFVYGCMALASAAALIWRHPLGHVLARAAAPIGACFTLLALATGSLWGAKMWGAWWVWDARLTSMLILFFLYLGYIALTHAFDDPGRGARAAAILALVGVVNIPIIKFSVDWWNTLHQPASIVKLGGPAIHVSILIPLLVMILGFTLFFVSLLLVRIRTALIARKIRALRVVAAEEPGRFAADRAAPAQSTI